LTSDELSRIISEFCSRVSYGECLVFSLVSANIQIEFAQALLRLLRALENYDKIRTKSRYWYPQPLEVWQHMCGTHQDTHKTDGEEGHDNDVAFANFDEDVLGEARKRNPEYTPFNSPWLNALSHLGKILDLADSRSFMYAIKAAVLSVLAALPTFFTSSAQFYYENRGVWVLIMAQLTLGAYSGDTTTALISRWVATFWGCGFGIVAWYIGSGSGPGNPYGLAAVGAVTFPFAMFFRIHFPGAVLTAVFVPVTFALVLGYSYLNGTLGAATDVTWGWSVAWRRFLSVVIGVTAAWIFSYSEYITVVQLTPVPPASSTRRAVRQTYARTINAAGVVLCDILSDANSHHFRLRENMELSQALLSWRTKLGTVSVCNRWDISEAR
jgi:hypothetical protein